MFRFKNVDKFEKNITQLSNSPPNPNNSKKGSDKI